MEGTRTPNECLRTVLFHMEKWVGKGLCQNCSIKVVAHSLDMPVDSVERTWIDHNIKQLDAETALD